MKGSPLTRALILLGVMLFSAWPLYVLTERAGQAVVVDVPEKSAAEAAVLGTFLLTFSKPALRVELRHLGKVVWSREGPGIKETGELNVAFPKEGVELGVRVEWLGVEEGALRLQATSPAGVGMDRSVWGAGLVDEIVSFP